MLRCLLVTIATCFLQIYLCNVSCSQETLGKDIAKISIDAEAAPEGYPYYVRDPNRTVGKIFFVDKMEVIFEVIIGGYVDKIAILNDMNKLSSKIQINISPYQLTPQHPQDTPPEKCVAKVLSITPAEGLTVHDDRIYLDQPSKGVIIRFQAIPVQGKFQFGTFALSTSMPIEYDGKELDLTISDPIVFRIRESIQVDEEKIIYNDYLFTKEYHTDYRKPNCLEIAEKLLRENLAIDEKDGLSLARLFDVLMEKKDFEAAAAVADGIVNLIELKQIHRLNGWQRMDSPQMIMEYFKRSSVFLRKRIAELNEKQKETPAKPEKAEHKDTVNEQN